MSQINLYMNTWTIRSAILYNRVGSFDHSPENNNWQLSPKRLCQIRNCRVAVTWPYFSVLSPIPLNRINSISCLTFQSSEFRSSFALNAGNCPNQNPQLARPIQPATYHSTSTEQARTSKQPTENKPKAKTTRNKKRRNKGTQKKQGPISHEMSST